MQTFYAVIVDATFLFVFVCDVIVDPFLQHTFVVLISVSSLVDFRDQFAFGLPNGEKNDRDSSFFLSEKVHFECTNGHSNH